MSFKVLVIPEDPTNNGYILKPLVEAILADAGKPNAKVKVLTSPRLNGFAQAKKAIDEELVDRYGFYHLWIFIPDADCAKPDSMREMENRLAKKNIKLLCCPAQPEVEIYACVAHRDQLGAQWETVRASDRMKEVYFAEILEKNGDSRAAGGGRTELIKASLTPI
ncbi:MAG: hypothetical protein LBT53_02345, partial [Puniceicoccales bacterium]|nr:hypothetical protein [Puniceicoccales bacterium]